MYNSIKKGIDKIDLESISEKRKEELQLLIDYVQSKRDLKQEINLNFICTHNSRRSQFAQVWAQVSASFYNIEIHSFSGGVEITAFNQRAIKSLERFGFIIDNEGGENPMYKVSWSSSSEALQVFSKLFDDEENPKSNFAAIMTCSHAEENCPFVPGSEQRIPLRYEDPKEYDDSPLESKMYDSRSHEIASEMMYMFSKIK